MRVGCPSNEQQRIGEGATGSRRALRKQESGVGLGKDKEVAAVILDNALGPLNVLSHRSHCSYEGRWKLVWQLLTVKQEL